MGRRMRAYDWTSSPLGAPDDWPEALRTLVRVMLASSQPMFIAWGSERIMLYNDGYAPMCANKHPWALGQPFAAVWADIINDVGPILDAAYQGIPTYMDDIAFKMLRHGSIVTAHFSFSYTPVAEAQTGNVLGMFCTCLETTSEVALSRQRADEIARLRDMFEQAPSAIALLDGPQHRFLVANSAYQVLTGRADLVGRTVAEALPEVVEQGFIAILDGVLESGKPYLGRDVWIELARGAAGLRDRRVLDFVYQPIKDRAGRSTGIFVEATDVTEQRLAEKQRELMVKELGHRLKNQLSVFHAIVNQTLRTAVDLEEAKVKLGQRLRALETAHQVLLSGDSGMADLKDVVAQALAPMEAIADGRITVQGPALALGPRSALSFSLIVHELATNALKYGALSVQQGVVDVSWSTRQSGDDQVIEWCWRESGGPPVKPPERVGFGSRLIRSGVSGAIDAPELQYLTEGLLYRLVVPVSVAVAEG